MTNPSIDWHILLPALLAGLLVLATHVPLGAQVLQRGIVFIDLAIAQIAGVGVIAADAMGFEPQGWAVQVAALSAALLGALALTWTERRWPDIQEALIGVLFVLASCAGLLLLAGNPHGGEHLKDLLVGQILWVSTQQLIVMAALTALVLALWFGLRERLGRAGFYLLFALAVTASVQLVGVYLVFTSLIVPALAVRSLRPGLRLPLAYAIGALGYLLGLALSARFDLPSGAVVVLAMAVIAPVVPWVAARWAKPSPPETPLTGGARTETTDWKVIRPIFRHFCHLPIVEWSLFAIFSGLHQRNDRRSLCAPAQASGRQEKRLQIAQEVETPLGRAHVGEVALNQALAFCRLQGRLDGGHGQTGARGEVLQGKTLLQPQRVEHEFKRQISAGHLVVLRHSLPRQRAVHVAEGLAVTHLAHHAVGKAELAVRARANPQVVAELPVVEVVPAAVARARA
jgi:zinc/manganese transport system permease protein